MNERMSWVAGESVVRSSRRYGWVAHLLSGFALSLISPALLAATCTVSASGLVFGTYDPLLNQNVDSVASIAVNCDQAVAYSVALSPGNGSYGARAMISGNHQLLYNLYVDATLTSVWGDGSGQSATVNANQATATHTVYGRVPAGQNAHVGVYSDTIVVTLTF